MGTMIDPIVADTARHYSKLDRDAAYQEDIERRVNGYLGTPEGVNSLMDDARVIDAAHAYLFAGLNSRLSPSVELARNELFVAARLAATHMAVNDFREQLRKDEEAALLARAERFEECWA